MAKTIRRKNAKWTMFIDYDLIEVESRYGGVYYERKYIDQSDKRYKKMWKVFHSDKEVYGSGVPGWFVNLYFQRTDRRNAKNELRKACLDQNYEVILPEYRKSAGYDWY